MQSTPRPGAVRLGDREVQLALVAYSHDAPDPYSDVEATADKNLVAQFRHKQGTLQLDAF